MKALTYEQQLHYAWQLVQILDGDYGLEPHEYYSLGFWETSLDDIVACLLATEEDKALALKRMLEFHRS